MLWTLPCLCCLLNQRQVVERVRLLGCLRFLTHIEHLLPILAGHLQHAKAGLLSLPWHLVQQALIDEGGHPIQDARRPGSASVSRRTTDGCCCLQGAATNEDGELAQEPLLPGVEQVIAPGKRLAQRLLAYGRVLGPTR